MKKISFQDVIRRITGFQTPVIGLNWEVPEPECETAKRVLIFLEDQRLLTSSYEVLLHNLHYVEDAIFRIRNKLTEEMEHLNRSSPLAQSIAAMRAACRKCLDQLEIHHCPSCFHDIREPGAENILITIGELRSTFGILIARLSVMYRIDIEKDLEPILPTESEVDIKHDAIKVRGKDPRLLQVAARFEYWLKRYDHHGDPPVESFRTFIMADKAIVEYGIDYEEYKELAEILNNRGIKIDYIIPESAFREQFELSRERIRKYSLR